MPRFMNTYDVEEAVHTYASHPVLGPAVRTLENLVEWTNRNSDGWAYWHKPSQAAARLMDFIHGPEGTRRWDTERSDATPEALAKALVPVKAFRTRQHADFEILTELPPPPPEPVGEVIVTVTRSAGPDGAVLVMIDTDFEPDASDGSPGLRVRVNDGTVFEGVAYESVPGEWLDAVPDPHVLRVSVYPAPVNVA